MRALLISAMTIFALFLMGSVARADYSFTFATSSGTVTNNFSVLAGGTVTIEVFLTQNGTGTSNGLGSPGLNQAGVQLNTSNPGAATVTATTANISSITNPSGQFDGGSTGIGANAFIKEGQVLSSAVTTTTNSILLGSFTFTASSGVVGNPVTTLTITSIPTETGGTNILGDGTVIDSLISNASATINVVAVPEPGSLILGGLLASGIVGGYVRRRRATVV